MIFRNEIFSFRIFKLFLLWIFCFQFDIRETITSIIKFIYIIFYQYILLYFLLKILIEVVVASRYIHVISPYYFFFSIIFFFQIVTVSNSLLFFLFLQSHNTFSVNFVIFLGLSLINLSWIFELNSDFSCYISSFAMIYDYYATILKLSMDIFSNVHFH